MIQEVTFKYQDREYGLQADVVYCGLDRLVVVTGGDLPHIGAVALAVHARSANDPQKTSVTPSLLAVPGHKEHQLALKAAEQLSKALEATIVVAVGIHIESISPELIEIVVEEYYKLIDIVQEAIQSS